MTLSIPRVGPNTREIDVSHSGHHNALAEAAEDHDARIEALEAGGGGGPALHYHYDEVVFDGVQNALTLGVAPYESAVQLMLVKADGTTQRLLPSRMTIVDAGYTLAFTPDDGDVVEVAVWSTTPLDEHVPAVLGANDPHFAAVSALLHFNGANASTTFTDQKGATWSAFGAAQLTTAQKKFGTASLSLDGSTAYATTPSSSALVFGTGDFTVEFWLRHSSHSSAQTLVNKGYNINGGWIIQNGLGDGRLTFYHWTGGSDVAVAAETAGTINDGQWYHIAVVRAAGVTTLYRDGTAVGSGADTLDYNDSASALCIGCGSATGFNNYFLAGQVDDFRITNGVARYLADFTPPAYAFQDA